MLAPDAGLTQLIKADIPELKPQKKPGEKAPGPAIFGKGSAAARLAGRAEPVMQDQAMPRFRHRSPSLSLVQPLPTPGSPRAGETQRGPRSSSLLLPTGQDKGKPCWVSSQPPNSLMKLLCLLLACASGKAFALCSWRSPAGFQARNCRI